MSCCSSDVRFGIELRELAGQHDAQLGAHFVAQLRIALGLGGLALQRVHLPRDFVEDVVDARQVQLGVFQTSFGQPLARLVLGDAGGLFDDGAAVSRLAAEDLPDAALLDDGVGLGAQAGAHEDVLNVAQAAELAVQQVFAFAGAEQAAGDLDLSGLEGALELAAANLENHLGAVGLRVAVDRRLGRRRTSPSAEARLAGACIATVRRRPMLLRRSARDELLRSSVRHRRRVSARRADSSQSSGMSILNVDFGLSDIAVDFGVDQRQRNLGHAGRLAIARAGEDDVLHVDAAQQSRRLFAQHPGDGVGDVRLAASVGADDGGDAFALKAQVGAVAERLEAEDLQLLQFEQRSLLQRGESGTGSACSGWNALLAFHPEMSDRNLLPVRA